VLFRSAIQAVVRIEKDLGVELTLQSFFECPTVEGIAARIGKSFSPDEPIVVQLRKVSSERDPLWCLLGVTLYQDLALNLDIGRDIVGIHVPFRYVPGRERVPSIEEVAKRYVDLIRTRQAHGPYFLLGLCFGGIVAYEVARQFEMAGEKVGLVVVLDAILPSAIKVDQLERLRNYARRAWRDPGQIGPWLRKVPEEILARVPPLLKLQQRLNSFTPQGGNERIDVPVDGPEVDDEVARYFSMPRNLASRLLVVRATGVPTPSWTSVSPDHGWGDFAGQVVVCDIAALHLQILRRPSVQLLAIAVAREMEPDCSQVALVDNEARTTSGDRG
jgi:thioesterase domain-containing protein